jgi:predicted DNA-binding transcriptional regulator YafY
MRKATRLFEIIQILRVSARPVTAQKIAERLEVTPRSIYRDIASLQAMRVPIEGSRGIGYILRSGFDLPPLMFSIAETEAIVLALALLKRTGDVELEKAADKVSGKIAAALPPPLRKVLMEHALFAWGTITPQPEAIDLATARAAIRDERKLWIRYRDEQDSQTERTIRPIALIYYSAAINIVAWCELREAIRHFRADRIVESRQTEEVFTGEGESLRLKWTAGWRSRAATDLSREIIEGG